MLYYNYIVALLFSCLVQQYFLGLLGAAPILLPRRWSRICSKSGPNQSSRESSQRIYVECIVFYKRNGNGNETLEMVGWCWLVLSGFVLESWLLRTETATTMVLTTFSGYKAVKWNTESWMRQLKDWRSSLEDMKCTSHSHLITSIQKWHEMTSHTYTIVYRIVYISDITWWLGRSWEAPTWRCWRHSARSTTVVKDIVGWADTWHVTSMWPACDQWVEPSCSKSWQARNWLKCVFNAWSWKAQVRGVFGGKAAHQSAVDMGWHELTT